MYRHFLILIATMMTTLASMAQVQRYEMNLGQYDNVRVLNDIAVDRVCNADSAGKVVFFAENQAVPRIILSNNTKGKLTVQTDNTIEPIKLPKVTVYVGQLSQVENASDSMVTVFTNAQKVNEIKIKTSGNGSITVNDINAVTAHVAINTGKGHITVNGKCQDLNISNVGTGEINAYDLTATNVKCRIIGTGAVSCLVNGGTLALSGSGTGKLYYKGKPSSVSVKKLGSLKAIPVDE